MRDIYLIDFENVASEGLSGITYLSPEDQVIIFYSANSNRLSMKMHILIGKSICNLSYFEVSVGGKNALDHQISTWLGYLIGTEAAERSYYIVSRDMGYRHVANFWAVNDGKPRVRCVETIRAAVRLERIRQEKVAAAAAAGEQPQEAEAEQVTAPATVPVPVPTPEALRAVTEPVLELKAASIVAETAATEQTVEQPKEVLSEPEPLESLEEPEPGSSRKSYRGRTRFHRSRGKGHSGQETGKTGHDNAPEHAKQERSASTEQLETKPAAAEKKAEEKPAEQLILKAEEKPAAQPAPKAEPKQPERPKPEVKPQPEKKLEEKKPEEKKPVQSERYSKSFWQKPRPEPKQAEQPKPEEKKEPAPKPEMKPARKHAEKAEVKAEIKTEPKTEPKPALQTEQKAEEKPEPKQEAKLKTEKKQPARQKNVQKRPNGEKPRREKAAAKPEGHNLEQLPRLIAPYPQLQENTLKELILANKRQVLCNTLRKQLGQEKGLALYNELKKSVWK